MMTTGVWCWKPTREDIELALELGFDRLDIMVNGLPKQRKPVDFRDTLSLSRVAICDTAKAALDRGIAEVHFTAWAMPHQEYMAYAACFLQWLCRMSGAHGIVLDAEEPWTKAVRPDYEASSSTFFTQAEGLRVGVTGIGYADLEKLAPLMRHADYGIPQCYSTNSSGVPPEHLCNIASRWYDAFGIPIEPALAAYRQGGIRGHTTRSAMRTACAAISDYDPCASVIYWSLRHIKGNKIIRDTLRRMLQEQHAEEEAR